MRRCIDVNNVNVYVNDNVNANVNVNVNANLGSRALGPMHRCVDVSMH